MSILSLAPDKQNYNHFFSETQLVEGVCKHRIGNRTFSPKVGPWSSNISLTTVVNAIWRSNSGLFLTTLFESRIYSMDLNFDFITLTFYKIKCTLIELWFFKILICNHSSKNSYVPYDNKLLQRWYLHLSTFFYSWLQQIRVISTTALWHRTVGRMISTSSALNLSVYAGTPWNLINSMSISFLQEFFFKFFELSASECRIYLDVDCSSYLQNSPVAETLSRVIDEIMDGNDTTGRNLFIKNVSYFFLDCTMQWMQLELAFLACIVISLIKC